MPYFLKLFIWICFAKINVLLFLIFCFLFRICYIKKNRSVDPYSFYADSYPGAVFLNADPDLGPGPA